MAPTATPDAQAVEIAPGWQVVGDPAEVTAAWVAALGELEDVARGREAVVETKAGGSYRYRYADLGDVLSQARTVLARHGLATFQVAQVVADDVVVSTTVMHTGGAHLVFAGFVLPAGNTAQATGSSITYARRYALMSILGLATDDDDGASAGTRTTRDVPDPVVATFAALTSLSPTAQAELRRLADEHDRKLSQAAMAADPAWLGVVRDVIDRDRAATEPADTSPPAAPAPVSTSALLATRAQLATLDGLERRAGLGLATGDVVAAVTGRTIGDHAEVSRHEADELIAAFQRLSDGRSAISYRPDGTVELVDASSDGAPT